MSGMFSISGYVITEKETSVTVGRTPTGLDVQGKLAHTQSMFFRTVMPTDEASETLKAKTIEYLQWCKSNGFLEVCNVPEARVIDPIALYMRTTKDSINAQVTPSENGEGHDIQAIASLNIAPVTHRGRGRPKGSTNKAHRGEDKVKRTPKGPYVPTGKKRGRPPGKKNVVVTTLLR